MPKAPALIGNLVESAIGRRGHVRGITEPALGFIELELHAAPPLGGWRPGHEIQFRVAPTLSRRYSVHAVSGDGNRIRLLAAVDTSGPGTAWIRHLHAGAEVTLLAGPHQPLRQHGTRRLYLGDSSALGTIDAYAGTSNESIVALEVHEQAIPELSANWHGYCFIPRTDRSGDALQAWLESHLDSLRNIDGALLLGHAQSIQRQRHALIEHQVLIRREIASKPYWATGRQGL